MAEMQTVMRQFGIAIPSARFNTIAELPLHIPARQRLLHSLNRFQGVLEEVLLALVERAGVHPVRGGLAHFGGLHLQAQVEVGEGTESGEQTPGLVVDECGGGDPTAATERLAAFESVPLLEAPRSLSDLG